MAKILIVEDDPGFAHLLALAVRKAGHEVAMAMDPPTGLVQMRRFKPAVVVLDIKMPAGGGEKFLDSVRAIPDMSFIPVIVVTGDDSAETKAIAAKYGVAKFFLKPVANEKLVAAIKELTPG